MKNLVLFVFLFFIILSCDNTKTDSCNDSADCGEAKKCFNHECYNIDDKIFGEKTIRLIDKSDYQVVSGGGINLQAQVVIIPTEEMRNWYKKNKKEKILDFVGPVIGQKVEFKILENDIESNFNDNNNKSDITNENGIAEAVLDLKNTKEQDVSFNVQVSSKSCVSKNFKIKVSPQEKRIRLENINSDIEVYEKTKISIVAILETHPSYDSTKWVPVAGDRIRFEIKNPSRANFINNGNVSSSVNVNTNELGEARVDFRAEEFSGPYDIEVSSYNTQKVLFKIKILQRDQSGCTENENCKYLGADYICKDGSCIYSAPVCEDCECKSNFNCPENHYCVLNKCEALCNNDSDCPNGLHCTDNLCIKLGRECKKDANCPNRVPQRCNRNGENVCYCRAGYCINDCSDNMLVELSGGSGNDCGNCKEGEICFQGEGINKCVLGWNANYEFDLIRALPDNLEIIFRGLGKILVPLSAIVNGSIEIPELPSFLNEVVAKLLSHIVDRNLPIWVQNLANKLNESIKKLENMQIKVDMAFIHDDASHENIKGYEFWKKFYIKWNCSWIEVKANDNEHFQVTPSNFTGNITCERTNGRTNYILNIDQHEAEFYFGRFVKAFLNGILIPMVSDNQAHSFKEVIDLYINCDEISKKIVLSINDIIKDWIEEDISEDAFVGVCESSKLKMLEQMNEHLNKLSYNDTDNSTDSKFIFSGSAKIEQENNIAHQLKDGSYQGTLKVIKEKVFNADWGAEKK